MIDRQKELIELLLHQAGYKRDRQMWVNNEVKSAFGHIELFPEQSPNDKDKEIERLKELIENLYKTEVGASMLSYGMSPEQTADGTEKGWLEYKKNHNL